VRRENRDPRKKEREAEPEQLQGNKKECGLVDSENAV
jgi:hypothetical protein